MEHVNVWKCGFCKKTSFDQGTIRKHEKKCFYNPETNSCASCLWFSPVHEIWPLECFIDAIEECLTEGKLKLETQCKRWVDVSIIEDLDIWDEHNNEALNLLLQGKEELLQVIEKLQGKLSYNH
jgi:hypothetical protein